MQNNLPVQKGEPSVVPPEIELPASKVELIKLLLTEWKTVIDTQMHFNEMLLRVRSLGLTGLIALLSVAFGTFRMQEFSYFVNFLGLPFHISAIIIVGALASWLALYLIDRFYYFRLLVSSVERSLEMDEKMKISNLKYPGGIKILGMTSLISGRVSVPWSQALLTIFYAIPALFGAIILVTFIFSSRVYINQPKPKTSIAINCGVVKILESTSKINPRHITVDSIVMKNAVIEVESK